MTPPIPAGRGSLKHVMDELELLAQAIHPSLNVYRYWRPDMALPAVWHWLTPGDVEPPAVSGEGICRLRVLERITVSIAVDPTAVAGMGDALELEVYHDLALPLYAQAIYARNPLGQREARIRGAQTVSDRLGDASVLTLELPLEVYLDVIPQEATP